MTSVVMIGRGRLRLTAQAIESLYANTNRDEFNLVFMHDCPPDEDYRVSKYLRSLTHKNFSLVQIHNSGHILARLKNLGAYHSRLRFEMGDNLLLCDNDTYFLKGWNDRMSNILKMFHPLKCAVLGGQRHPFHGVPPSPTQEQFLGWSAADAVAGTSQMMRWSVWGEFGPLIGNAPGACQSEDFAFCQKLKHAGYGVGYIDDPAILDCGITQTDGSPSPGSEVKPRVQGVIYE